MRAFDIANKYNQLKKQWDMWYNIWSSATKDKSDAYKRMVKACEELGKFRDKEFNAQN